MSFLVPTDPVTWHLLLDKCALGSSYKTPFSYSRGRTRAGLRTISWVAVRYDAPEREEEQGTLTSEVNPDVNFLSGNWIVSVVGYSETQRLQQRNAMVVNIY